MNKNYSLEKVGHIEVRKFLCQKSVPEHQWECALRPRPCGILIFNKFLRVSRHCAP